MNKVTFIEQFVTGTLARMDNEPVDNLRTVDGVLYSLEQPIALFGTTECIFVDSASHTFQTNIDIMEVKRQCDLNGVDFLEINFREAGYLLTGTWDAKAFTTWAQLSFDGMTHFFFDGGITLLKGDVARHLVVGRTLLAIPEFQSFLGIIDTDKGFDFTEEILLAYQNAETESAFLVGNLLISTSEFSLKDIGETVNRSLSDACTVVVNKHTNDAFAVGRINHKWYPKRLELNDYHAVSILPIRFIK